MPHEAFTVVIDHLQEEPLVAATPEEAARAVTALIGDRATLRALPDDEPVQIKRPDRRPWGRNLTLGDFRNGDVAAAPCDADGPVGQASIASYHGIASATEG